MMTQLDQLVRPNIRSLKPYSSARDDFKGREGIFLDANENPYGTLNRYPDPLQHDLKERLAAMKGVSPENIFIGNGSDEAIDLAIRVFCEPRKDAVVICPPTYGMYEVSAGINDVEVIRIPLGKDFQPDVDRILGNGAKILFLCSPNNPTGNSLDHIDTLVRHTQGIVFLDEAYIDFSRQGSLVSRVLDHPNLIVAQTFSKARANAGIRVGTAYADREIIGWFNKVKPPYNVSTLSQQAAVASLDNGTEYELRRRDILAQRAWLEEEMKSIRCVRKIFPSDANFLLVEVQDANHIYATLLDKGIVTRNRNAAVKNCLRITVGTPRENERLINELKKL